MIKKVFGMPWRGFSETWDTMLPWLRAEMRHSFCFEDETFGLVLTDLNMPGMDGLSLAERIRKESTVPIVLITASDKRSVEGRLMNSSVDSVLYKPFRVEELLAVVVKAFSVNT